MLKIQFPKYSYIQCFKPLQQSVIQILFLTSFSDKCSKCHCNCKAWYYTGGPLLNSNKCLIELRYFPHSTDTHPKRLRDKHPF